MAPETLSIGWMSPLKRAEDVTVPSLPLASMKTAMPPLAV
jgi:hypothetical protein